MKYGYVDVNLKSVTEIEWSEIRKDEDYGVFGYFDADKFEVVAKWNGAIKDKEFSPQEFWQPFEIEFFNVERTTDSGSLATETVKRRKDPLLSGRYKTPTEMMNAYRKIIRDRLGDEVEDREIYESEYDKVLGYNSVVPKSFISMDEGLLEELIDEVAGDKPDESLYGDGGW